MTEKSANADNRRKYIRVHKNIPVRIHIPDVGKEGIPAHLASVTKNISLGGVLIEFSDIREVMWAQLKKPDLPVTLEMFFPEYDERISVQAVVKWVQDSNKFLARNASVGIHIIEDPEKNPNFPRLCEKLTESGCV